MTDSEGYVMIKSEPIEISSQTVDNNNEIEGNCTSTELSADTSNEAESNNGTLTQSDTSLTGQSANKAGGNNRTSNVSETNLTNQTANTNNKVEENHSRRKNEISNESTNQPPKTDNGVGGGKPPIELDIDPQTDNGVRGGKPSNELDIDKHEAKHEAKPEGTKPEAKLEASTNVHNNEAGKNTIHNETSKQNQIKTNKTSKNKKHAMKTDKKREQITSSPFNNNDKTTNPKRMPSNPNTKGFNLNEEQITLSPSSDDRMTDPNTDGSSSLMPLLPSNQGFNSQIRQRKSTNEPQKELPLPSNNNDRTTDVYYKYIKYIVIITIVIFALFVMVPNTKPTLFQKFADTTSNLFKEFNSVELPDVNTVMDHSVVCRRAAITFQRSVTFKSYGSDIAAGLRDFGETIKEAGHLLREIYSKSSSIYTSFDMETDAMIHRINLNSRKGDDARYFHERLNRILTKIKDVRQLIEKARNRILDVEEIRHNNEVNVENGLREAEKYSNNEKYSIDFVKAKKDLTSVDDILGKLYIIAGKLEKLGKSLKYYEDKLSDVSDEVKDDDSFEFTKKDLKYLELAVDNSKASYNKFNRLHNSD